MVSFEEYVLNTAADNIVVTILTIIYHLALNIGV